MLKEVRYIHLNGVKTFCFSSKHEVVDYALQEKSSLLAVNAEKILHANDRTRNLFNKNIGFSDGIGAVWALKRKGFKNAVKIPGCELWLDLVRASYHYKTFYLIGAKQEIIEETVEKLKQEFQGINIVNYRNGYLRGDHEKGDLFSDIRLRKPDVVFLAMGSPRQELLMEEMIDWHPAIYMGLGGSFDVYTGRVNRAPEIWVSLRLEWLYRLLKQPSRIRRQIYLIRFLFLLLMRKL